MSSTEISDTAGAERPTPARPKSRRLYKLAVPAVLLGLTVSGLGMSATAHADETPSCSTIPNQTCPAPPYIEGGTPAQPMAIPRGVQAALNFFRQMGWPNFRNIAYRGWTHDMGNNQWVESGGEYYDYGGTLMNFMHRQGQDWAALNYRGTFQEYYGSVYASDPERSGIRTGNFRIVRALGTGDLWVSLNHYTSFRYVGRM